MTDRSGGGGGETCVEQREFLKAIGGGDFWRRDRRRKRRVGEKVPLGRRGGKKIMQETKEATSNMGDKQLEIRRIKKSAGKTKLKKGR